MGHRLLVAILALVLLPAAPADAAPSLGLPGLAFGRDAATGRIEVLADETVTAAQFAALARHYPVRREPGQIRILIAGGQAVYTGASRCSLGANVRQGSVSYFVTAGHCTNAGVTWWDSAAHTTVLGTRTGTSFPGNDYGIVRYTNTSVAHPSAVYTYPGQVAILRAGNPSIGLAVCRSGSTTGVRCGVITGLNATVNYAQGSVTGLIRTNICAEPGDSGGPLYVAATGVIIGILSGGSGNCTTGGTTFYQPIAEILAAYGVTIP
ncbi:serine protease [Rhizocola hellebori]|uniref:Serine protease n=1 Tax=Rhizocola hellebori TaxID=1392758 RepID=A0A8J3Q276_9ACTN|nr:S1 family peptidase [Rhizocola hellebori]GIH02493.1 serine protease [Rhizocola hellebori]